MRFGKGQGWKVEEPSRPLSSTTGVGLGFLDLVSTTGWKRAMLALSLPLNLSLNSIVSEIGLCFSLFFFHMGFVIYCFDLSLLCLYQTSKPIFEFLVLTWKTFVIFWHKKKLNILILFLIIREIYRLFMQRDSHFLKRKKMEISCRTHSTLNFNNPNHLYW